MTHVKYALAILVCFFLGAAAYAQDASLTLPGVTIISSSSMLIVCTPATMNGSPPGHSGTPGTLISSCMVTPAIWTGAMPFAIGGNSGGPSIPGSGVNSGDPIIPGLGGNGGAGIDLGASHGSGGGGGNNLSLLGVGR